MSSSLIVHEEYVLDVTRYREEKVFDNYLTSKYSVVYSRIGENT